MVECVLAFGANLGDRVATIKAAQVELANHPRISEVVPSPFVESVAIKLDGPDDSAPSYINGVAIIHTDLSPADLLHLVQEIEQKYGRVRNERWGDRTLDIDIITYGNMQSETAQLTLPHPRAAERDFVLAPWLKIDAAGTLHGYGKIADILARIGDNTREYQVEGK